MRIDMDTADFEFAFGVALFLFLGGLAGKLEVIFWVLSHIHLEWVK